MPTHTLPKTAKNIAGERYGRLVAASYQGPGPQKRGSLWLFRCDCSAELVRIAGDVRRGMIRSCGCAQIDSQVRRLRTHGRSRTPEWATWNTMKMRCTNPNNPVYRHYGGRGIVVCDRWLNSFAAFFEDMGERPSPKHRLDRIDNDGPYSPDNCRWATQKEQCRNTRQNRLITFRDETLCITDWAARLDIHPVTLHLRVKKGWPLDRALTTR